MRSMIFVIDDQSNSGSPEEMAEIDKFNERLRANEHWVFAAGLGASRTATLIDNRGGISLSRAGSIFDSKEYYSGFWIIDTKDLETAHSVALEASKCCYRRVELRPFLGQ
jgi:hypothetical protein